MQESNPRAAAVNALMRIEIGVAISDALDQALKAYRLNNLIGRTEITYALYGCKRQSTCLDSISRIRST